MPAESTVRSWAIDKENPFSAQYEKARLAGYGRMADELLDIADDGTNDYVERERENGTKHVVFDSEHVQRSRLRVDTRKWLLSKALPKVYGDKIETTNKVQAVDENGKPLPLTDLSRHVAFLLASGMKAQEAQPDSPALQ